MPKSHCTDVGGGVCRSKRLRRVIIAPAARESVTAITSKYGLATFLSSNTPPKAYFPIGAWISVTQTRKVPVRAAHKAVNISQKRIPVTAGPPIGPRQACYHRLIFSAYSLAVPSSTVVSRSFMITSVFPGRGWLQTRSSLMFSITAMGHFGLNEVSTRSRYLPCHQSGSLLATTDQPPLFFIQIHRSAIAQRNDSTPWRRRHPSPSN